MKYKINISGFAYVEADNEEQALEKFLNDEETYKEMDNPTIEEVDEFTLYI